MHRVEKSVIKLAKKSYHIRILTWIFSALFLQNSLCTASLCPYAIGKHAAVRFVLSLALSCPIVHHFMTVPPNPRHAFICQHLPTQNITLMYSQLIRSWDMQGLKRYLMIFPEFPEFSAKCAVTFFWTSSFRFEITVTDFELLAAIRFFGLPYSLSLDIFGHL